MNAIRHLVASIAVGLVATTAQAQFVKGNEAVRIMPDGSKKVDLPPTAGAVLVKPCPADKPSCSTGGWRMVETVDGIRECTEIYARASTCRPSTLGSEKRSRLWVVKLHGQWMQCQYPDIHSKCVSTKDFPYSAVQ